MHSLARIIMHYRAAIIVAFVCITGAAGWFLKDLRINPDVVSYFPPSDPAVQLFKETGAKYGGTSLAVVGVGASDVFAPAVLRTIAALTKTLATIPGICYVTSLTNVIDIRGDDAGIVIGRLIDPHALPDTPQQQRRIKDYALSKKMIKGRIVSEDARMSLILCRLAEEADDVAVARCIRDSVAVHGKGVATYFAGFPFQMHHIAEIILNDLATLAPIASLAVIICLFVGFRSFAGVAFPLLTAIISTVWILGLMAALQAPLSLVSNVLPVILIAVGSAYGIHVVNKYRETAEESPGARIRTTMRVVGVSVLLAGLTTMIGFLSFIFGSYLTLIRDFGIFASLGICFALIVSLTLIPALLTFTKTAPNAAGPGRLVSRRRVLTPLAEAVCRRPAAVFVAGVLLAVLCGFGITRLERNAAVLDYFKPSSAIRQAEKIIARSFGGSIPITIAVKGDLQDPAVLNAMKDMSAFLQKHPMVHNVQSVADLIEEMHDVMGEGRSIPNSKEKVSNLWFLLEGEEIMAQLVNEDYTEGVISATCENLSTRKVRELVKAIDAQIAASDSRVCSFRQTGLHLIYRNLDDSMIVTLYQSLALSLALVFICLLALLRSVRGALLGCIPIVFTLLIIFGAMGWAGLPLDVVTVLIGSVSIGIGVDYAIHFSNRFRSERSLGKTASDAVRATIETTGSAIVINAVTVACGFMVLVFANLVPLQQFGALVALTMVSSATGAMTLLPASLLLESRSRK